MMLPGAGDMYGLKVTPSTTELDNNDGEFTAFSVNVADNAPTDAMTCIAPGVGGKVATVGKPVVLFTKPKTMNGWWRSKTADRFLWRTVVDPRESVQYANYIKGWDAALK